MHRRYLVAWLVLLTAAQGVLLVAVYRVFVGTRTGQAVDTISLTANWIGQDEVERPVNLVLNAMSVASLAAMTALVFFIAVVRRRFLLAVVALVVIAGANVTTQLIKVLAARPDYGIDPDRSGAGNSLPSGHTTVAASVALALVLVLPRPTLPAGSLAVTAWAAFAGVATLSAGWHRPSDAVAAFLVAGAWASFGGLLLVLGTRSESLAVEQSGHRRTTTLLLVGGVLALAVGLAGLWFTHQVINDPVDELSRQRLLAAYAGGAAGIAGAAAMTIGLAVATVGWVVPRRAEL